jgi:hypothetical protein
MVDIYFMCNLLDGSRIPDWILIANLLAFFFISDGMLRILSVEKR